jgi:hypothetical protein
MHVYSTYVGFNMLELRSKKSGWIGHQKNDQQAKITTYNPLWKQPTFVSHPLIAKNHTRKKKIQIFL